MLKNAILKSAQLESPLGPMLAIADDAALYLLEFVDARGVAREVENLCLKIKADIVSGNAAPLSSIKKELKAYFSGNLKRFETPLQILGTPFQKVVWSALMRIPYGETRSYAEQAVAIKKSTAYRAVANANGANQLAIIVPCHRIINTGGALGGYGGGIKRKKWLLDHEQ
jgi:AraC family transcriptional regulator of adaptative response/methylated-DNA-[protein]-cysteine methyltransferase